MYVSLSYKGGGDSQRTWVLIPQAGKGAMEGLGRNTGQPLIIAIQYDDLDLLTYLQEALYELEYQTPLTSASQ